MKLKQEFDIAPGGKAVHLENYTIFEWVYVLLEYIATVPGLLGPQHPKNKRYGVQLKTEKDFAICLAIPPEKNFDFILFIIAFFAAYAELGRFHKLKYQGWIERLAQLFHTILIRPFELGDKSSIETLELVLKKPQRVISVAIRGANTQLKMQRMFFTTTYSHLNR